MSDTAPTSLGDRRTDRFYGKYRGLVADNQDPLKRGRIKARVPAVLGDTESGWAEPCTPFSGTTAGFFAIPSTGTGVWVEFEAGDVSRPVWVGGWWATGEAPISEKAEPPDPQRKILRSDSGLVVSLDDSAQTITLSDSIGVNLMTIKVTEATAEVRAAARVTLEALLIEHGERATHPAVFGDNLLAYLSQLVTTFNTHVHPGQLAAGIIPVTPAPPVAPMTPPTPALVSVKNLVG
jgi:hypothetical protein